MRNRSQRLFLSGAVLLSSAVPFAAQAAVSPPSDAASVAARAGDVVSISDTEAHAKADGSNSRASVIRVAGQDVAKTGGAAQSDGEGKGNLLTIGPADVAEVEVAPWEVAAKKTPEERTSHSRATLLRVRLLKQIQLSLLDAQSDASHKDGESVGTASTDAAHLSLADKLDLILLRSEIESGSPASSYLVGLNGNEIGTDESLGGICALAVSPLFQVACLLANGGTPPVANAGPTSASAAVANASTVALAPIQAFQAAGTAGKVAAAAAGGATAALPAPVAAAAPIDATTTTRDLPTLPRTGVMAGLLAFAGMGLLGLGLLARRLGRARLTA